MQQGQADNWIEQMKSMQNFSGTGVTYASGVAGTQTYTANSLVAR